MTTVPNIGMLSPVLSTGAPNPHNTTETAADFDAMVLEVLLRQSGLLQPLSADEGGQAPLLSDMFLPTFAHELAAQMNLGFGSLLMNQAAGSNERGNQ